jgi:hypothetical protein
MDKIAILEALKADGKFTDDSIGVESEDVIVSGLPHGAADAPIPVDESGAIELIGGKTVASTFVDEKGVQNAPLKVVLHVTLPICEGDASVTCAKTNDHQTYLLCFTLQSTGRRSLRG